MNHPPRPVDLDDAIEHWSDHQVQCRAYGHSWRPRTVIHAGRTFTIYQWCNRGCGTTRHMDMSETGQALSSWRPRYTGNYLLVGLGRVIGSDRDRIRLASIRGAVIVEASEEP